MIDDSKLILLPGKWTDYQRFKPLCCVDSTPAIAGPCWTAAILAADVSYIEAADVGFVGYSYAFRNNSCRLVAMPEIRGKSKRYTISYLNRHVRCLTRIMVRPSHRGRGIATKIIQATLPIVGVRYVECLTFTESIALILKRCGFVNYGQTGGMECDYWLHTLPQ